MDLTIRIIATLISLLGVAAGIYNIVSSRSHYKQGKHDEKVDQALALSQRNEQNIANLTQRVDEREARTKERLDQIGKDVADVKKLFQDFIIDNLRAMTRH
ncbi:hypothetical protein [Hymenobacter rubidus]|uniref:hypothetical protein n=1 Tax=Hymenobacter rubidus TaxID=1441626 RepID=UPI00191DE203|nr:hypothetical protein [Hymenobacter rubidus]